MAEPELIAHWYHLVDGLEYSSDEFYKALEARIKEKDMPNVRLTREDIAESGMFSAKRVYIRARRNELTYHICAAPFGKAFFFSSWLHGNTGCLATLASIPFVGVLIRVLIRPLTFYAIDSAIMFQEAMHATLQAEIDELLKAKEMKPLSEEQRKPVLSEFYAKSKR